MDRRWEERWHELAHKPDPSLADLFPSQLNTQPTEAPFGRMLGVFHFFEIKRGPVLAILTKVPEDETCSFAVHGFDNHI
jgi:hypothetical protein